MWLLYVVIMLIDSGSPDIVVLHHVGSCTGYTLYPPSNNPPPLPNRSVLIREMSFGERQQYVYLLYMRQEFVSFLEGCPFFKRETFKRGTTVLHFGYRLKVMPLVSAAVDVGDY